MKVSLQTANKFSNVDLLALPREELLQKIGAQLGAVEEVIDWGARYQNIYVVKVVKVSDHPNADKLHVCLIDDGGIVENMTRDENGYVQIVCGAPEIAEGMIVAWLSPGTVVPSSADKDPFTLDIREIRGIPSPGMLGTPSELGLSDDHSGLLQIDPKDVGEELTIPGTPFVKLYGLDDLIIDCENKMFTHRPDCFGMLGVAREFAGMYGKKFESPEWYKKPLEILKGEKTLPLEVFNQFPELAPRHMAVAIDGIQLKPSPLWLQSALTRVGIKSINNIVDITNFMMILTGQPMHAFDYHKIEKHSKGTPTLGIRMAKEGEKLSVLSGKDLVLTSDDIVLSTDETVADLAGIMGGAHTEIDENTKAIILTCDTFDMYAIRKATMRHGVFTDAATRYTKGQSSLQNDRILAYAVKMIQELSGGMPASEVFDDPGDLWPLQNVTVDCGFINSRLDAQLSANEISEILSNVEFEVVVENETLSITAPFWRTDIEIPEDIVEEIGRLYGYDKLPVLLPKRSVIPASKNPYNELCEFLRSVLSRSGANEILSYSFVSGSLLQAAGQNVKEAYQLSNALSPELQYYRLTLTPSLLSKVYGNIRAGYDSFALFEIGKTHLKLQGVNEEGLPQENAMLSLVYAANDQKVAKHSGAAYFQAKAYLDHAAKSLGLILDYEPLTQDASYEITKPFDCERAALVTDRNSGNFVGIIGEYNAKVRSKLKLPVHTAGFEIMLQPLLETASRIKPYWPLSKYPGTDQDVTFSVPIQTNYATLESSVQRAVGTLAESSSIITEVTPKDIYAKAKEKTQNITFHFSLRHNDRTITTEEANKYIESITDAVQNDLLIK